MRKKNSGFTMIETLIALSLSSFIMLALMQAYRSLVKYIEIARQVSLTNQHIVIFAQTFERDLSAALMPIAYKPIASDKDKAKDGKTPEPAKPENSDPNNPDKKEEASDDEEDDKDAEKPGDSEIEKGKKKEKKQQERKRYFSSTVDDADFRKIKGKKVLLLKELVFITTNALEIYGESMPRLVRVRYALVRNKKSEQESYTLVRSQTTDIHDYKMKKTDDVTPKEHNIVSYDVLKNVKGVFIEFSLKEEKEQKDKDPKKEKEFEEIRTFAWGQDKKSAGKFPQRAYATIVLWDAEQKGSETFELEIPMIVESDLRKLLGEKGKDLVVKDSAGVAGKTGLVDPTKTTGLTQEQPQGGSPGDIVPPQGGG